MEATVIAGIIVLLSGLVLLLCSRLIAYYIQKTAFHKIQEHCNSLNSTQNYNSRNITFTLVYSRNQTVNTGNSSPLLSSSAPLIPKLDPFALCLAVPIPTLYIEIPNSKQHQRSNSNSSLSNETTLLIPHSSTITSTTASSIITNGQQHVNPHSKLSSNDSSSSLSSLNSNFGSGEFSSNKENYVINMKPKRLFCTHCGSRTLAPQTPLIDRLPNCIGCHRPIELPSKYQVNHQSLSGSLNRASPSSESEYQSGVVSGSSGGDGYYEMLALQKNHLVSSLSSSDSEDDFLTNQSPILVQLDTSQISTN